MAFSPKFGPNLKKKKKGKGKSLSRSGGGCNSTVVTHKK